MMKKFFFPMTILFLGSLFATIFIPFHSSNYFKLKKQVTQEKEKIKFYHNALKDEQKSINNIYQLLFLPQPFKKYSFSKQLEKFKMFYTSLSSFVQKAPFSAPFDFPITITSKFGLRIDPFTSTKAFHTGIDIMAPLGKKIKAVADGLIVQNNYSKDNGYFIKVKYQYGFLSVYAHMLNPSFVKKGFYIQKGDTIGYVGMSGRATAPHLHYEIIHNNLYENPKDYLFLAKNLGLL